MGTAVYGAEAEVKYGDFGAAGDGVTDDFGAIFAAHAYANEHNLPVRAHPGATYYIGRIDEPAEVQTSTDWTSAEFIIDDSGIEIGQGHNVNIFVVTSKLPRQDITGVSTLKKGQETLDIALERESLIFVEDNTTRRYIRRGANANDGATQREVFLADKNGNVDPDGPIIWDYDNITTMQAIPVDDETLTLKGGTFTTRANKLVGGNSYFNRGIQIRRSNVVVDGLEHYVTGEPDERCAPYAGILLINDSANVLVQNSVFSGRRQAVHGSYDIQLGNAVNVTFKNCTQANDIHDRSLWGVMGANYMKNITYDTVSLSRFDAHAGVYNAAVKNSVIGHAGITLIGGGTFLLENTAVHSTHLISFREDYGSTWEGELVIRGCVFKPSNNNDPVVFGVRNDGMHDFGYKTYMPRKITIDGLLIDDVNPGFFRPQQPYYNYGPSLFGAFHPYGNDALYFTLFWDWLTSRFSPPPHPIQLTREVRMRGVKVASGRRLRVSKNIFRVRTCLFRNMKVRKF